MNDIKALSGDEALDELMLYFLGDDYYIVDPLHAHQANAVIVDDIKIHHKFEKRRYRNIIFALSILSIIQSIIIFCILR